MNRKIVLLILLLSFFFSWGLSAVEMKSSTYTTEIEVLVENESDEKEKDEQDIFFEKISFLQKIILESRVVSNYILGDSFFQKVPHRPPIV